MNATNLPGGLFNDNTAELFALNDKGYCLFNGARQDVSAMPTRIKMAVMDFYKSRPECERAYEMMVGKNDDDKIEQCVKCMFGNFDNTTDLDGNGLMIPEIVSCPKRSNCKFNGIGCLPDNSSVLSPAELAVSKLAHLPVKQIANKLFRSSNTIERHLSSARKKTGVSKSWELSQIFNNKNIMN